MDDRHLSNIPKLKKKQKNKKKNTARKVNQTKGQSQFSAEHASDRRREEGSEEKSGKEGKLERNEHVLVVFVLVVLSFLKACAASVCLNFCSFLWLFGNPHSKRAFQSQ
jgi:hypothetical protein